MKAPTSLTGMRIISGNALGRLLPWSNFEWLTRLEISALNWQTIDTEGEFGYLLKVDLKYPNNIHDTTQDFPLAPESDKVTADMLTPYMSENYGKHAVSSECSLKHLSLRKLLMTCREKKEYAVRFKMLKFYLEMGMRVTKIHALIR